MESLFNDLQVGLREAIDFANGKGPAHVTTYVIDPVRALTKDEIKQIRSNAHMTQVTFADYMGVSVKTVEERADSPHRTGLQTYEHIIFREKH